MHEVGGVHLVSYGGIGILALTYGPLQRLRICLLRQLDAAMVRRAGAPGHRCTALLRCCSAYVRLRSRSGLGKRLR